MSDDIRSILDRLATVEGKLTPGQQKVPQLPALFKPRSIRALGSKTDPAHPMDGYMVGDSVEPRKTALEEAMAEIEEDMLSKVKKDLTTYLDRLEKKVSIDRELKDKAQDAVEKGEAEEDIEEVAAGPVTTFEMADGSCLECWGDDANGYEIRHGEKRLPSRFKNLDDAGMAVRLYQARKQRQQRPEQDLNQDYIEER